MLKTFLLSIHIAAGFSALAAAFIAAITKMLNLPHKWHVYSGRVFFGCMTTIFLTAVSISLITGNIFLLLVAIFSFYLASSGWSYAKNRSGIPQHLDWLRTFAMLIASVVMASYGIYLLLAHNTNGITMLVFAGIGRALSISDLKSLYSGGVTGKERISRHLTMMLAASIATITAFVVVNFRFNPTLLLWLAPTAIITPIIVVWNIKIHGGVLRKGMPQDVP
jgi:hypothetical protein